MVRRPTHFGSSVSATLAELDLTQNELSGKLGKHKTYVNHTITGHRRASAAYVDLVADVLNLSNEARVKLHKAAAKDHGFKLDLTE